MHVLFRVVSAARTSSCGPLINVENLEQTLVLRSCLCKAFVNRILLRKMQPSTHEEDIEFLLRLAQRRQQTKKMKFSENSEKDPLYEPPDFVLNPGDDGEDPMQSDLSDVEAFDDRIR